MTPIARTCDERPLGGRSDTARSTEASCSEGGPEALEALVRLAQLGGEPVGPWGPVDWSLLRDAAARFDPFPRGSARRGLVRRDAALLRVHRSEQARLLVEGAELALAAHSSAGAALLGGRPPLWECWRARARRELATARASRVSGASAPRALVAAVLWAPTLLDLDGARALARAAVALAPGPETLLSLARARALGGAQDAALAALERARRDADAPVPGLERARLVVLARRGDHLAAHAGLVALAQRELGGIDEALGELGLGLALVLADPAARGWAASLGEGLAAPERLQSLAPYLQAGGPVGYPAAPEAGRGAGLAQALAARDPALAATQVARLVVGGTA